MIIQVLDKVNYEVDPNTREFNQEFNVVAGQWIYYNIDVDALVNGRSSGSNRTIFYEY